MAPNVDIILTCVKFTTLVVTERTFWSKADLKGYHFVLLLHVQVSDMFAHQVHVYIISDVLCENFKRAIRTNHSSIIWGPIV